MPGVDVGNFIMTEIIEGIANGFNSPIGFILVIAKVYSVSVSLLVVFTKLL